MASLLVLAAALLALWTFGLLERDDRAAFMRDWVHVPFIAAVIVLLMVAGAIVRDLVA